MSLNSAWTAVCLSQYILKASLTSTVVDGRFCAPVDRIRKGLVCCLPCPLTDYLYPAGEHRWFSTRQTLTDLFPEFNTWYRVAEALNVAGLICLVFLMATFLVLPAEKTRRHYLSYCLIVAAMFMAVSVSYDNRLQQSLTIPSLASLSPLEPNPINAMTRSRPMTCTQV